MQISRASALGRDPSPARWLRLRWARLRRVRTRALPVHSLRRRMTSRRSLVLLALVGLPALGVRAARAPAGEPAASAPASPLVLEALGSELPLHMNPRVERWMDRFRADQRAAFQTWLDREGLYSDMIREKLRSRGMPEELVYMAMMESGLKPRAVSSARAVGLWQFMGPTARQYGLRIDRWVDERRDPVRATDAALEYLTWLHDRYDSWYLAAAAYNAGPGRVDRVLRRYADGRTGDEDLYWEVLDHLPRETRHYVPRIVAATLLAASAGDHGFTTHTAGTPYVYDRVFVPGGTSLARVARAIGGDVATVRELNPHLLLAVTPPGEAWELRVPPGTAAAVVGALANGV